MTLAFSFSFSTLLQDAGGVSKTGATTMMSSKYSSRLSQCKLCKTLSISLWKVAGAEIRKKSNTFHFQRPGIMTSPDHQHLVTPTSTHWPDLTCWSSYYPTVHLDGRLFPISNSLPVSNSHLFSSQWQPARSVLSAVTPALASQPLWAKPIERSGSL